MARRPGGVARDRAIERAEVEITGVKVGFDEWLGREFAELVAAFAAARLRRGDAERFAAFRNHGQQIRDVAATMHFALLAFVAESLCELLNTIGADGELPTDPIVCHLDALALAARPDFRALRPNEVPELTGGLSRVAKQTRG